MAVLPEAMLDSLRTLARALAAHRRGGGTLDTLPDQQQDLLRATNDAQRQFFMEELAKAEAEWDRGRFRESLGRWRDRGTEPGPDAP